MELVHSKGYRMYKVSEESMPRNSYIICSRHASGVLYRPQIAGKELQDRMEKVAEVFLDAIGSTTVDGKKASQVTELIFLSGGLILPAQPRLQGEVRQGAPAVLPRDKKAAAGGRHVHRGGHV